MYIVEYFKFHQLPATIFRIKNIVMFMCGRAMYSSLLSLSNNGLEELLKLLKSNKKNFLTEY